MAWQDDLQPASFRGVKFYVEASEAVIGRATATHVYPYRETKIAWVEDMGNLPLAMSINGFMLGEDILDQHTNMVEAVLKKGPGELVHPYYGSITGSIVGGCRFISRKDRGRYLEISFSFVKNGKKVVGPIATPNGILGTIGAALKAVKAAAANLVAFVRSGLQFVQSVQDDLFAFGALALSLVGDATSVLNSVFALPGSFGRDAAVFFRTDTTTEAEAIKIAVLARADVATAVGNLMAAPIVPADVPDAVQAVLKALLVALPSPDDQIRACVALHALLGSTPVAVYCREAAAIALAQAASSYQPTSYDGAIAVLLQVTNVLDVEITAAGDREDDEGFNALIELREAVAADLTERGATLAPLITRTFGESLPGLALAALLYDDAARVDELVRRVDPPHPLFFPFTVQVLAK